MLFVWFFYKYTQFPRVVILSIYSDAVCTDLSSFGRGQIISAPLAGASMTKTATLLGTLHGQITAKEYMDRLGNQVHPMIQTFFLKNDNSSSDPSVAQPIASRYTDCAIPAHT
jgi:hypothetical protein